MVPPAFFILGVVEAADPFIAAPAVRSNPGTAVETFRSLLAVSPTIRSRSFLAETTMQPWPGVQTALTTQASGPLKVSSQEIKP